MKSEHLLAHIKGHNYSYLTRSRELKGVFYEIDQHLLHSSWVTEQCLRQILHYEFLPVEFILQRSVKWLQWDCFVDQGHLLHVALRLEYFRDEIKHFDWAELLGNFLEFALLNLLDGQDVIDKTKQEVELRHNQIEVLLWLGVERNLRLHQLKKHERGADRGSKLMRYGRSVARKRLISILLLQ